MFTKSAQLKRSSLSLSIAAAIAGMASGAVSFDALERSWTRLWRREFARRLAVGRALQTALFRPWLSRAGLALLARAPALGRMLISATRE